MKSNPILWDTDFDGFSDAQEINDMHTSPLKYNYYAITPDDISRLGDNNNFPGEYINLSLYASDDLSVKLFAGDQKKRAIKTMVDYFYKYRTTDKVLSRTAFDEKLLGMTKTLVDGLTLASDVMKLGKSFVSSSSALSDDIFTLAGRDRKAEKEAKELIEKLVKGKHADITALNELAKNGYKDMNIVSNVKSVFSEFETSGNLQTLTNVLKDFVEGDNVLVKVDKVVNALKAAENLNILVKNTLITVLHVELPCKWDWVKKVSESRLGKFIGKFDVVIEIADIAKKQLEVWEVYGQIAANCSEYQKYLDVLRAIEKDSKYPKYVRAAASEIAVMFTDSDEPDWFEFSIRVADAQNKELLLSDLNLIITVGGKLPGQVGLVFKVVDAVRNLSEWAFKLTGITQTAQTIVDSQSYYSITDTSRTLFYKSVRNVNGYLEARAEGTDAVKYIVQLAQSRIVGLDTAKEYLKSGKIVGWLIRLMGGKKKEDIEKEYNDAIDDVYDIAEKCNLELSKELPRY